MDGIKDTGIKAMESDMAKVTDGKDMHMERKIVNLVIFPSTVGSTHTISALHLAVLGIGTLGITRLPLANIVQSL